MDTDPLLDDGPFRLRLDHPDDVLAYLPYRFGFVPTDSLAVLAVLEPRPGEITVGLAARLDLADLARPAVLRATVEALTDQLDRDPTVGAITVVYSDIAPTGVRAGWGVAGRVLQRWLAEFAFADPTATYLVTPTRYRCLECAEPPCCPAGGHDVERLRTSEVAAQMVLEGEVLVPTREALRCSRDAPPERAATAARAAQRERRARGSRSPEQQRRWRRRTLDRFGAALDAAGSPGRGGGLQPAEVGRLGAALDDPDLRDAVVAWTLGGRRLPPGSHAVLDAFGGVVTGALAPPPQEHLDAACIVLTEIARHAAPGRAGYPLAVLAWLAWWRGHGARADVLRQQSLEEEPGNTLSLLLCDILDGGVRPGWALPGWSVASAAR